MQHMMMSAKIVYKLKNTMSARHAAEKLFNNMLHDFRAEILRSIAENWDKIYFLVGLADTAEETVKQWEAHSTSKEASTSSGTQRLIRTACKAFHHRGSQQCGSSTLFRTYLRKQGIPACPVCG